MGIYVGPSYTSAISKDQWDKIQKDIMNDMYARQFKKLCKYYILLRIII